MYILISQLHRLYVEVLYKDNDYVDGDVYNVYKHFDLTASPTVR